MVKYFDHVTIVVRDVEVASRRIHLFAFEYEKADVITGETFSNFMG